MRGKSGTSASISQAARESAGVNMQQQQGINPLSISDQFREAFASPAQQDLPMTPFHKQYPNFGTGHVDYGFSEPGADKASEEIIRAYHAVLPEGQLAGTKKELMPVFSGINQEAVEQRPILQSLGKNRNTLYLGGVVELPDELRIDPRQALLSGSNIPTGIEQTAGELASALETLGMNHSADGIVTGNPYGATLPGTRTLAGAMPKPGAGFYSHDNFRSEEPLVFGAHGYEFTSSDPRITTQ